MGQAEDFKHKISNQQPDLFAFNNDKGMRIAVIHYGGRITCCNILESFDRGKKGEPT
jgi:hypothetical protein